MITLIDLQYFPQIFFHFLQYRRMIIRSKFQSPFNQKKTLSINTSKSTLFKTNFKITKDHQHKNTQSIPKSLFNQSQQSSQKPDKLHNCQLPSLQTQNFQRKKSLSRKNNSINLQQKRKTTKTLSLVKVSKHQNVINHFTNSPLIQHNQSNKQPSKSQAQNKPNFIHNRLAISNLLSFPTKKSQNLKISCDSYDQVSSFDNQKELISPEVNFFCRSSGIRKSNYSLQQGAQQQHAKNDKLVTINWEPAPSLEKVRIAKLCLQRCTFEVVINPSRERRFVSVQIQTIQEERQFFDYLRYKRKKSQFESQLQKIFSQMSLVKDDRALYDPRVQKLIGPDHKEPLNQRQERVFNLRSEIVKLQKGVEKIVFEKYRRFQDYIKEFQKIEDSLALNNAKCFKSISKYQQTLRDQINANQVDKVFTILKKVQKIIKENFTQSQKKLSNHVEKGRVHKQDAHELIQAFKQYNKSLDEHKGLLKNCFGHIKKIPELCYGLVGDKLPDLKMKTQLRNSNNEFKMPKCMECFNSQWKLHMIIEKNQLMQSIFKVTEELLK